MRRALMLPALVAAAPALADPQVRVSPYVEVGQGVDADLTADDTVTYTEVAAGVDASVQTARVSAQADARYEHDFVETGRSGDADLVSGLARVSYRVAPPLTIEAGALATRARADIRGADPVLTDTPRNDNLSQLYSVYAGPTLATTAGPLTIGASYRFGFTHADAPGNVSLAPGTPRLDYFSESYDHALGASVGVAPGRLLPVGITVSGGWERSDADQLDQRFDDLFARGDVLAPVTRTLALTAGVGWERLSVTERDPLLTPAGTPVLDANGRFVTDQASAPHVDYRTDGLIYDAGIVWRPSPRTQLTATVAHQYDSTTYTGNFGWQIDPGIALDVVGYDAVETFGHQLREGLQALPTDFLTERDSYAQQFNGCVFGGNAAKGAGGCLTDALQSVLTASYRAKGLDAVLTARRGPNSFGLGAGYAERHLFAPLLSDGLTISGENDRSWYLQGFYARTLTQRSTLDANLFANWYTSGLAGSSTVFGAGATGAYTRSFGRLGTSAQLGVYTFDQPHVDEQWNAEALLGARYQF